MASLGTQRFNNCLNALQEEFSTVQADHTSTNSSRTRRFNIYLGGLKAEYELLALQVESQRKEIDAWKAKTQKQGKELQDIRCSVGCERCRKRTSGNLTIKALKSTSSSRTISGSKQFDKPNTPDISRDVNLRQEMTTRHLIPRTARSVDPESDSEDRGWSIAFNNDVKKELDVTMAHTLFHGMAIWYVNFSQDGKYLAAGCRNGKAYIYDVGTGALKHVLRNLLSKRDTITAVCFSCDRKYLATGLHDGKIYVWEIKTKYVRNAFKGHTNTVLSLHFSPKGRLLASASRDNTIRLWNMRDGAAKLLIEDIPISLDNPCYTSAVFSPDGRFVAASHRDGMVRIWDARAGQLIRRIKHIDFVEDVIFTPDGIGLLSGHQTLNYWDVCDLGANQLCARSQTTSDPCTENTEVEEQTHPEQEFFGHERYVRCLGISSDGRWFASCSDDSTVRIWSTRDATTQCVLNHDRVWAIDFSPAGQYLASGGSDGMVRIWRYSPTTFQ